MGVGRIEHGAAIPIAEQILVETGQQMHGWGVVADLRRLARHPVDTIGNSFLDQRFPGCCQACLCLRRGQPCPAHQILQRGRPVAGEVAPGQLSQSLVSRQAPGQRDPLIQQGKGLLFAAARAKADQPVLRRPPKEMVAALARRRDARLLQRLQHFITGELLPALQRFGKHLLAARKGCLVQFKLAVAAGAVRDHPRGEERQQPTDILRGDEMQRAAHRPGAHDGALGDRLFDAALGRPGHAQPDRPERPAIILGLHRAQPGDDIAGLGERRVGDAVIGQPGACDAIRRRARGLRLRHKPVSATPAPRRRFGLGR